LAIREQRKAGILSVQQEKKMFYRQMVSVSSLDIHRLDCRHKAQFCLFAIFWIGRKQVPPNSYAEKLMQILVNGELSLRRVKVVPAGIEPASKV
jgi:hypothetical protein